MNIIRPSSESVLRKRNAMTHSKKNEKCKTMSTIGVFQFTMSLLKKTHHHRDLSTTHRTARIQLSY